MKKYVITKYLHIIRGWENNKNIYSSIIYKNILKGDYDKLQSYLELPGSHIIFSSNNKDDYETELLLLQL